MDDIVERLRLLVPSDSTGASIDAADEITRLRAENAELVAALRVFSEHFGPLEDNIMLHPEARRCFHLARAAISKVENK